MINRRRISLCVVAAVATLFSAWNSLRGFQSDANRSVVADPFAVGHFVVDSNGDGLADVIAGKVVVPDQPSAAENAAAANIAARLGYASTGLTPPVVVAQADNTSAGPRIYVSLAANGIPARYQSALDAFTKRLSANEGGVFAVSESDLVVTGKDEAGLLAAAEALSSRAPYLWRVPGDRLAAISDALPQSALEGLTYLKDKAGIERAFLKSSNPALDQGALEKALALPKLSAVHQLVLNASSGTALVATGAKELPAIPRAGTAAGGAANGDAAAAGGAGAAGGGAEGAPAGLDLGTLFTMRGLFRGTPRMPIPSSLDSQLYVPAGKPGIAMANLAARMGLESTGLTLPLAVPVSATLAPRDIRTKSVIAEGAEAAKEAVKKLGEEDAVASQVETALAAGEGEARIVDKAFGRQPAVLIRGDTEGASAALSMLSDHFPNVWEPGKQHLSLEEVRFELHRFFSLRSAPGQTAAALYRLDKWMDEIKQSGGAVRDVEARIDADLVDPALNAMVSNALTSRLGVAKAKVTTASLHAGTQCCEKTPLLHYQEPGYQFQQGKPTFADDLTIPWEGKRLVQAIEGALGKVKPGEPAKLLARVSEGPEQRQKLTQQITAMLTKAGAKSPEVTVLCAYKPGYSWLMDDVAPRLKGKPVASLKIEFKKNEDATRIRSMYSPARWVQELYPVDEDLARTLQIPLDKIELAMFESAAKGGPTYRVHAYDAAGKELLSRDFAVTTVMQPYNGVMKSYEQVEVETGWVRLDSAGAAILDQRIRTDLEEFWDHYQNQTLPRVYQSILAQAHGEIRPEYAPAFDTLRIDIHLSEPNYRLGIDKELISSLEALQEDTFYTTENFVNMIGELQAGRPIVHVGRIMPIVHASEDGKDGRVRIEFYAKPAANPQVELSWTGADGTRQVRHRDLPALNGAFQPRLIQARVKAGVAGPDTLTWILGADFSKDEFAEWTKLEGQNQIEHSIFPVEQARGQMKWLEAMHAAGMYPNDLSFPYIRRMNFEFELPRPLTAKVDSPAPREFGSLAVPAPRFKRPMISDYNGKLPKRPAGVVQWDEPIPPSENAAVLAKLAENPGVNVYWMGRSYLGIDLWAADITLPTPSTLRSWAKETTLKASVIYSGRQHANEVSSTSHILKLGEQLVTDPGKRQLLKQVNVVLHPITNADGAELSVQLAEITPDNMLHPGYHGALAADVSVGQRDMDPLYPESRTRKLLQDAWLPDTFLNPHGYPSHEWVQPFSEYSGWVQSRQGANPGRSWWIPRGWFTSLSYSRDPNQPYSEKIAHEIKDRIADAQNAVPGLMELEGRMNARYQRFGQRWQPRDMQQPLTKGVRIYMSLKGGGNRGGGGVEGPPADITWNSGYTEAPDETAHGEYMKLMASAGLAFDYVHLNYLAQGKLRIQRTEREQAGKVSWSLQRLRPNLPAGETEPPRPDATTAAGTNTER